MNDEIWSYKDKTNNGNYVFIDLKDDGCLQITFFKPKDDGTYDRERLIVSKSKVIEMNEAIESLKLEDKKKAYTLDDVRKKVGSSAYAPWTPEEEKKLVQLHNNGLSVKEIAQKLARSNGAITSRLEKLGINL